jgi:flagellar basal-body rod protein FlgF
MDRLSYAAISGLRTAMARQAATAHNLSNTNTPGFRGDMEIASTLWQTGGALPTHAFSSAEVKAADMRDGAVSQTGNPLDVALHKDALLTVQAPNGEEAYTRRGDLQVSDSGLLTTGEGTPVLGESGPITIPPNNSVTISSTGMVSIVPIGGKPTDVTEVDKLKLVSATGSRIVKGEDNLFRVQGGGALPSDPDARLDSGAIEGSNVNASDALIQMIEAGRSWETQVKMLATAKEIDTSAAQLMQLPE